MIEIKDIEKLALLARLEVPQEEKESLKNDVDTILAYVGSITKASELSKEAGISHVSVNDTVSNVLRDDTLTHESGIYTDALLREVPDKEDGYVKVKKIL